MKLKNIIFTVEIKGRELRRIILRTYENKDELKNEINKSFAKYISEFDIIPESLKDKRVEGVDRTPAENLAYQVGWTTLVLKWESDERKGLHVKTPSDDFKWNQLGELYQWFTDTYAHLSLQELKDMLKENINSIYEMIDSLSDEELFEPHMRKWADEATKTAVREECMLVEENLRKILTILVVQAQRSLQVKPLIYFIEQKITASL